MGYKKMVIVMLYMIELRLSIYMIRVQLTSHLDLI